jgi:hypothetical protein
MLCFPTLCNKKWIKANKVKRNYQSIFLQVAAD